jgi:hypothetical protein
LNYKKKKEVRGKEMVFDRKEYDKEYYQKNKEKIKEQRKKSYEKNKEKNNEYSKNYRQKNKEKIKEYEENYRQENKEKIKERDKEYNQKMKELVYNHYSNGVIECACCGEKEIDFLSIDHIHNDGGKHRKKLGGSHAIFRWAIKNNFSPIFQLLCMNCNFSKGKKGNNCKCIHQIRREEQEKRKVK